MILGHGPAKLVELIEDTYQATRSGRGDLPPIIKQQTEGADLRTNSGVVALRDRNQKGVDRGRHDTIHCYQPDANPPISEDRGYSEEQLLETVQLDIDLADRTTPQGVRSRANERMIGDLDDLAALEDPPYPGLAGEVKQILEGVRRGYSVWDTVSHTWTAFRLGNSAARVSFTVELEQIARDTVQ